MVDRKVYETPSKVSASDGVVTLEGPDSVEVRLTAEAAEVTSDRLLQGAMQARGQRYFEEQRKPR